MYEKEFPTEIMIEVANCCNNKCFYGSDASDRKRGIIDYDLMIRLINEAYLNGSRKISFHGMGELLLCKDLLQYIAEAKSRIYLYLFGYKWGTGNTGGYVSYLLMQDWTA